MFPMSHRFIKKDDTCLALLHFPFRAFTLSQGENVVGDSYEQRKSCYI